MEGVKEFLESSSIHGLGHVASTRVPLIKLLWIFLVFTGFTVAGFLIQQSFSSWADSPISTTIETLPITDIDFPNVTVCPPKNSFTSLIPDLVMSRKMIFDEEKRKELSGSVHETVFEANYEAKYQEFLEYGQRKKEFMNWYSGLTKLSLPHIDTYFKKYRLETSSLTGSISTPYFRNSFDENRFEKTFVWTFNLFVPSNLTEDSNLVVDIQYDLALSFMGEWAKIYWESQHIGNWEYDNSTGDYDVTADTDTDEKLEKTKITARRTYLASEYSADGTKLV